MKLMGALIEASVIDANFGNRGLKALECPARNRRARYVGAETDLLGTYNFTRHLQGYAGYSYFYAGRIHPQDRA